MRKSTVELFGKRAPDDWFQKVSIADGVHVPQVTTVPLPPESKQFPLDPSLIPSFIPPALVMLNRGVPEAEAVKMSPDPELFTLKAGVLIELISNATSAASTYNPPVPTFKPPT